MKPLRVSLRQFGPYAQHVVDLTPFHAEGLFLVHGDTGAGKSTLLDALAWSLYGKGLGSRTLDEHLRNKSASPDEATEVVVDFSLHGRPYRLRRSMAYARPARRGSSVTTQRPEASLTCLDPTAGFAPVSTPTAVNDAVEALLGLKYEQFSRIIVLPQGEFRSLLLATAADQERMLKHLFGTERFDTVEARLRAMSAEAESSLGTFRSGLGALLHGAGVDSVEALAAARDETEAALGGVTDDLQTARQRLQAAQERLQRLSEHHRRAQQRAALRETQERLDAEATAHRDRETTLRRAERADGCVARIALEAEARSLADKARDRLETSRQRLQEAARALGDASLSAARELQLVATRDALTGRVQSLELLEVQAQESEALGREVATHTERLAAAQASRVADVAELTRLRDLREARRRERAALDNALRDEGNARNALDTLDRRRSDRDALRDTEARRDEAARRRDDLQRRLTGARQRREEAARAREVARQNDRRALAATLAAALADGDPCPVCGGRDHPEPAQAGLPPHEAETALAQAEERLDQARAAEAEAQRQLDRSADAYEQLRRSVDEALRVDPATEEELDQLLAATRVRVEAMATARTQRGALDRALDTLDRQVTALGERVASRDQDLARLEATLGQLVPRAEGARLALERAGVDPGTLAEALAQGRSEARTTAEALAVLLRERSVLTTRRDRARVEHDAAARELSEREQTLQQAQEALNGTLAQEGFATAEEAQGAALDKASVRKLRAEITRWQDSARRLAAEQAALGDDETAVTDEDLAQAAGEHRRVQAHHDDAQRRAGALDERARQLAQVAAQAGDQAAAAQAAQLRHDLVHRVERVVNGHNDGRIRLGRYVLLEQFDRVVACASARLEGMSDGRFRLRRRELKATGKEFELAVDDAYTGAVERAVATLSGGEMFMASLAMALGLGDVLQAWSGGVRVESLFVDEGFGSLDDESLDKAVAVLERLPDHARMVGVVSHVPELRKRIAARLEVVRTERGSITRSSVRGRAPGPA